MYSFGYLNGYLNGPRGRPRGRGARGARGNGQSRGRGARGNGQYKYQSNAKKMEPLDPELIDPKSVYIRNIKQGVSNSNLKNHLSKYVNVISVSIIKPKKGFYSYGFAELASEDDATKLLLLTGPDCFLNGRELSFQAAKKWIKMPGVPGFERVPLSDRDYELEPVDVDAPCIHSLIDDVMLKVFDLLPLKTLIRIERVCRRWQSLSYLIVRRKVLSQAEDDLSLVFISHNIPWAFNSVAKVLLMCGEHLTEISLSQRFSKPRKSFRTLGQLCSNLEKLEINVVDQLRSVDLVDFTSSCQNLKEIYFKDTSFVDEECVTILLSNFPHLRHLHLTNLEVKEGRCFELGARLEVLRVDNFERYKTFDTLRGPMEKLLVGIADSCPNLTVLRLDKLSVPSTEVKTVGQKCPRIEELGLTVDVDCELSSFKNLKSLVLDGLYNLSKVIESLPNVESVKFEGTVILSSSLAVDFSLMPRLKDLTLPWNNLFCPNLASLKTITQCSELERLNFKGCNEHKEEVLEIIRKCQRLKELYCPTITLVEEDISAFVEANKTRSSRLKLVIGLDQSALDQIERLTEANYDINMFDAHNLFCDMDLDSDYFDNMYYDDDSIDDDYSLDEADFYDLDYLLPNYEAFQLFQGMMEPDYLLSDDDY